MRTMLCRIVSLAKKKKREGAPVHLNVYDLTPINGYAYWLGLGVYHSGVEVHGIEYGFGAHEHTTSGIFEVEPNLCPGFTFRKSILIGKTDLGQKEVRAFMEKLAEDYPGNSYHLITKNCNHFCNDVCIRLAGKSIPKWVNRLARLGSFCNCVLPSNVSETKLRHVRSGDKVYEGEKKKLRSQSSRFPSSGNRPPPSLSSCPPESAVKRTRQRSCLPPSSSLIHSASTPTLTLKV